MIVVDTNLLIYLNVQGQRTEESEAVLKRDAAWAAPLLWRSEFRNVLIGMVRKGALALEDALAMVDKAERWLAGREYSVVSRHALMLADQCRLSGLRLRVCGAGPGPRCAVDHDGSADPQIVSSCCPFAIELCIVGRTAWSVPVLAERGTREPNHKQSHEEFSVPQAFKSTAGKPGANDCIRGCSNRWSTRPQARKHRRHTLRRTVRIF